MTTTLLLAATGCAAGESKPSYESPAHQPNQANPRPPQATGNPNGQADQGAAPGFEDDRRPSLAPGEIDPRRQPQSTFGLDVDTASYSYARSQLLNGNRPDPSTIRPEEFINSFRQDYRQPPGDGFTVNVDGSRLPTTYRSGADGGAGSVRLVRIGLQTRAEDEVTRPDASLTFVVDVSGSMGDPNKLDLVKDALHTLVDQLRTTDEVALVAYSDRADVLGEMTPVRDRQALHRAIDRLRADGGTNLESGLVTGYEVARAGFRGGHTNRVILLSDGLANIGNTSAQPILARVRENAGKKISLLGVGVGNDYGDALMEQLADQGDGYVTYVSDREQAHRLFVQRLPAALGLRALDAKVQVTFDPRAVAGYRLIGYDNRGIAAEDFRDDRVDGGEVGPGHSVTALYLVRINDDGAASRQVAEARVRWQDPRTREAFELSATVRISDLQGSFATASPRLRVDFAAAWFAETLRDEGYANGYRDDWRVRLSDLKAIADGAAAETNDPMVEDLSDLIRRAG